MKIIRANWLLGLAVLIMFVAGHGAALAHTVSGHAECATAGWVTPSITRVVSTAAFHDRRKVCMGLSSAALTASLPVRAI